MCGCHKGLTNATKAHPILRCKLLPQRPSSLSTKGFLEAEPAFTILGHASTTELEAPKNNTMLSNNKYQDIKYTKQGLWVQGNPRHKSLKQMRGESKSLQWGCRSRPPPLILQRSRALVGWGGRSYDFCGSNNGVIQAWDEQLLEEEGGGIYTPPKIWLLPVRKVQLKPELSLAKAGHTG
jgi:hypothetical protein